MAGTTGSPSRKVFVAVLATLGFMLLLLFCARLVSAQQVVATWYGPGFEGNLTANGEVFDPSGYTAAHKTYEFGTKLIVTYEGRSVVVRINDRGPYVAGRDLDLSQGAAEYIGLTAVGVGTVDAQIADPSTPVGPYSPQTGNTSSSPTPQAEPAAFEPAAPNASGGQNQNSPARQQNAGASDGSPQAAAEQAVVEEQYATEDQYEEANQGQEVTTQEVVPEPAPPAPPAPKPAVPVLPPEPEPEALLSPPEELAVPNSTVQKRVEFEIAAAPTPQPEVVEEEPLPEPEPAPEPAPEPEPEYAPEPAPEPESAEEPEIELTVLPDTGGAPFLLPVAGALLMALGVSIRILRR